METLYGGTLPHACIISGPSPKGRAALTERLSRAFVCSSGDDRPCCKCAACLKSGAGSHPDIITVGREEGKREITVDQIRFVRSDASVLPNEAEHKVYVIKDADTMNTQAQNAFLKTLEEPPAYAVFLLETENPEKLLPTVRSRCVLLTAPAEASDEPPTERGEEFLKTVAARKNSETARLLFSMERLEKSDLSSYLSEIRKAASSVLRGETENPGLTLGELSDIVRLMDRAEEYGRFNVGAGHISALLMASLMK